MSSVRRGSWARPWWTHFFDFRFSPECVGGTPAKPGPGVEWQGARSRVAGLVGGFGEDSMLYD
jgi:hypothetical protein